MLYPHVTHVAPHAVPHLGYGQLLPQTGNIDLQREVRINKADGLVIRPNHHELNDEHGKMQANREIKECVCCKGRCNTHCPHKNTQEPYYPLDGNTQECSSKVSKILDGLPMSLGQAQHKRRRNQWPNSVVKNNHLY